MKLWLISGIIASVLVGLGGYTIHKFGQAKFDAGALSEKSKSLAAVTTLDNSNAIALEDLQNETQKLPVTEYDNELSVLGILRQYTDR